MIFVSFKNNSYYGQNGVKRSFYWPKSALEVFFESVYKNF